MSIGLLIPLADTWGMHGDGDIGAGWWIVMMLGMVIFWGAIILVVVWLVRGGFDRPRPSTTAPMDILERRFAEGEISVEDYYARRKVLANGDGSAARGHSDEPATEGTREGST